MLLNIEKGIEYIKGRKNKRNEFIIPQLEKIMQIKIKGMYRKK